MFPRTLNVSETLRKLRGWSLKYKETLAPRRISRSGAPTTVPGTQLDRDVLLNISEHLFTPGDRLALAMISRWHYSALIRAVYAYINLPQGIKVASLVEQLLANEVLCSGIRHVDIVFPPAYRSSHQDIVKSTAYYSQRQKFIEGAFVVLKLATRLKTLSMHHFTGDSYAQLDLLGEGLHDIYPFNLKHLSAQTVPGTLSFVERQTQLERLVLFPVIEYTSTPRPSVSPISLPRLHILWAPPWWTSLILPYSPVRTFGLLPEDPDTKEPHAWRRVLEHLARDGGHTSVSCLVLPYDEFFWNQSSHAPDRHQYAQAFPNVTKLRIVPRGLGTERFVSSIPTHPWPDKELRFQDNTETSLEYTKQLLVQSTALSWPAVGELVFLRPGDDWPNRYDKPYLVKRMGKYCETQLLEALERLLPHLRHVDFERTCYKRSSVGGAWSVRPRTCQY